MAVTIRIYNNATQLASKDIPDGAVTQIQAQFPAATAALSAAAFLNALAPLAKQMVKQRGGNTVADTHAVLNNTAHVSFNATFETDWP
jgi:hypothetical protein